MASATPYPDGSNRTEGGPCQDDLRPEQGFTPILVYAQVFGEGFPCNRGALRIKYYCNTLQCRFRTPGKMCGTCKLPRSTY
jgi:hypothetical protein